MSLFTAGRKSRSNLPEPGRAVLAILAAPRHAEELYFLFVASLEHEQRVLVAVGFHLTRREDEVVKTKKN